MAFVFLFGCFHGKDAMTKAIDKKMGLIINPAKVEFSREPSVNSDPLKIFQPYGLTPREIELLSWIAQGKSNKDIEIILSISLHTVTKHLEHIYTKLGVRSRTGAVVWFLNIMHQAQISKSREGYTEVS